MADKNSRLSVLYEARRILEEGDLTASDREDLLKLTGVLIVALEKFTSPEEWLRESRSLASEIVSSQAIITMLKHQADELDALKKLSLNLTSSLDLPTVLDAVVQEAMRLMEKIRTAHIFLFTNGKLEFGASLTSEGIQNRVFNEPRPNGLTYTVAHSGETVIVEDMKTHPLYHGAPQDWDGSIIGMPLKIGDKVVGVMNVSRLCTGEFSTSELRLLSLLADQAAVAISNASLHQIISEKAYSDTVTGLPNRRALDERLDMEVKKAWRSGNKFAVIMMDLDGFKMVNDTYGHDYGDQVLRASFNAVSVSVRATDFLARYGGDELTLILSQSDLQAAKLVTEKILENFNKFNFSTPDGNRLQIGISGGIAMYPSHGKTPTELLRAADAALYNAKKHYRGTFVSAKVTSGILATDPSNNR